MRRDLDCGDPRRRRYREKLLASSIGGEPVRVCVGVIVDHTDLSSIASSTIMTLTEISIWHLVYVELIFGRPHAVKPDVSYDGSEAAAAALRYGHHAHDERVGVGRRDGQETRDTHQKHHQRRHSRTCAEHGHRRLVSEVVPENRRNRGGAGAGRKETALSPGSARRGARRTSGARNSSYGVGRSRDPVGGRGIGSAVAGSGRRSRLCNTRFARLAARLSLLSQWCDKHFARSTILPSKRPDCQTASSGRPPGHYRRHHGKAKVLRRGAGPHARGVHHMGRGARAGGRDQGRGAQVLLHQGGGRAMGLGEESRDDLRTEPRRG
mmetsp:Transcript_9251/g.42078  ORF Transcript_9251/g.42078 Transcript_9251/m.42078 type:complete len:323 (+) Transcript_9251:1118-2086(+)